MRISMKNLIAALKSQLPLKRAFKNFFIKGNAWGLFSINSHISQSTGKEKVAYGSKDSAMRAAQSMRKKYNTHFSVYKCAYCDGWHSGKNRDNKKDN